MGLLGTIFVLANAVLFEIEYYLDLIAPIEGAYIYPIVTGQPYLSQMLYHALVILSSIGFVGVFSMKGRNLGFVFPFLAIMQSFLISFVNLVYWDLSYNHQRMLLLDMREFLINVIALTGGVCLLIIRKESKYPRFFTFFAFLFMTREILKDAIYFMFFSGPLPGPSVSDFMAATFPSFVVGFGVLFLTILVFLSEHRADCLKRVKTQDVAHVTKS